jgi:uncharacterized membrane protein YvbJ
MKKLTNKDQAIIEDAIQNAWNNASDEEKHRFFLAYIKNPKAASGYMVEKLNEKYHAEALVEMETTVTGRYYNVDHGRGTACWNVEDDF